MLVTTKTLTGFAPVITRCAYLICVVECDLRKCTFGFPFEFRGDALRSTVAVWAGTVPDRTVEGGVNDSYDDVSAETTNGIYKVEVVHRRGSLRNVHSVERPPKWATGLTAGVCLHGFQLTVSWFPGRSHPQFRGPSITGSHRRCSDELYRLCCASRFSHCTTRAAYSARCNIFSYMEWRGFENIRRSIGSKNERGSVS